MPGDVGEHRITSEQDSIAVDGALRDVRVRSRSGDPSRTQRTAEVAYAHPVAARRFVERELAQQILDGGPISCPPRTAHELGNYDGRKDHDASRERFFQ